jgi:hypothetical protein
VTRKLDHAKAALAEVASRPRTVVSRSAEEWQQLSKAALWKAMQRERDFIVDFFTQQKFRMQDMAAALKQLDLIDALFNTAPFQYLYVEKVRALMVQLESEHYGEGFGLYMH